MRIPSIRQAFASRLCWQPRRPLWPVPGGFAGANVDSVSTNVSWYQAFRLRECKGELVIVRCRTLFQLVQPDPHARDAFRVLTAGNKALPCLARPIVLLSA